MKIKYKRPKRSGPKYLAPLFEPTSKGFIEIAQRASSIRELQIYWRNAFAMDLLTKEVKDVMRRRAVDLKKQQQEVE